MLHTCSIVGASASTDYLRHGRPCAPPNLARFADKTGNVIAMNLADNNAALRTTDVRRRFDRAAAQFDGVDFVHAVARDSLLARLDPIPIDARIIVDLGCATGSACRPLTKRFRRARIIAIDLSLRMLEQANKKRPRFAKTSAIQADATTVPLADHSVDLIYSNMLLPWIDQPASLFREVARILRKDGLFLFATLGPDSLLELRNAWQGLDPSPHVNRFLDMHDIGDVAVRAGLRDPVLDVDRLTVTYQSAAALLRDLTAMGGRNSLRYRRQSLIGKNRFRAMTDALNATKSDGIISLDLELVYGHCWGSGSFDGSGEIRIDAAQIGRRR